MFERSVLDMDCAEDARHASQVYLVRLEVVRPPLVATLDPRP